MMIIAVFVIFGLLAGCVAFKGDIKSLGGKIEGLAAKIDGLANQPAAKAEAATPASRIQEFTVPAPTPAPPTPAPADPMVKGLEQRLAAVEVRQNEQAKKLEETDARVARVGVQLVTLTKRVAGIEVRVKKVNARAGATVELTNTGGERYFLIGPFKLGSAEVSKAISSQIKKTSTVLKAEDLVVAKVVGSADETPFKSAKDAADNLQKNLAISKERAEKVAKELGGAIIESRGMTQQFGDLDANRCVMIIAQKAPTSAPAQPAAQKQPAAPPPVPEPIIRQGDAIPKK